MNTIDRHIGSEWLKAFAIAGAAMLGLQLLWDASDNLSDLLDFGAEGRDIAVYYLVLVPSLLPAVVPLALLLSVLFSVGALHRKNEIIVMRACGMSLPRITRSLWAAGGAFTVLLFFLNAHWVPWSVEASRQMLEGHEFRHELGVRGTGEKVGLVYNLGFANQKHRRLWSMNRFSEFTDEAFGLMVNQFDAEGREIYRLLANRAVFDAYAGRWTFHGGRVFKFDPRTERAVFSLPFESLEGDLERYEAELEALPGNAEDYELYHDRVQDFGEITLAMGALDEEPELMKALEKPAKDLSFAELGALLDRLAGSGDTRLDAYAVRYHGILANPVSCLIVIGIAVPFAVAGVRVNPMVGASKALGLFLAYFVLNTLCTLLGEGGGLPPVIAAWTPVALMGGLAAWLWLRRT